MNCQFLQNAAEAAPLTELPEDQSRRAREFTCAVGVEHFSYLLLRRPQGCGAGAGALQSSYPEGWVARYRARGYQHLDPAVSAGRRARLPFRWGHGRFLRGYRKRERLVFHEAKTFGVTEGWAVPVHGPDGDAALFSLCSSRAEDVEEAVRAAAGGIQLFAAEFHAAVIEALAPAAADAAPPEPLSERERAALAWTSEGLTTEQTAVRLGLSASAVNYHLRNAARKLGAASKGHAAMIALRRGLI